MAALKVPSECLQNPIDDPSELYRTASRIQLHLRILQINLQISPPDWHNTFRLTYRIISVYYVFLPAMLFVDLQNLP